jgi:hypothetical protein
MVLEKFIYKTQKAFIRWRLILDPVLIASKCLDSRLKSTETGVVWNMDLEKAYNHVNWDFLLCMPGRCGFWERCIGYLIVSP